MHPPRLPFDTSAPFVARTDFTHDGVEYKAGASFDPPGIAPHDKNVLWRAALIDVAGPEQSSPAAEPEPTAPPVVPPPKPAKQPRSSARS